MCACVSVCLREINRRVKEFMFTLNDCGKREQERGTGESESERDIDIWSILVEEDLQICGTFWDTQ